MTRTRSGSFFHFKRSDSLEKELKQLEKVIETIDNLVKLIKMTARDIITLTACVIMIKIIFSDNHKMIML